VGLTKYSCVYTTLQLSRIRFPLPDVAVKFFLSITHIVEGLKQLTMENYHETIGNNLLTKECPISLISKGGKNTKEEVHMKR